MIFVNMPVFQAFRMDVRIMAGEPYFPVRMREPWRWSSVAASGPPDDAGYIRTIMDVQYISLEW
jgi:hypothetical protein